MTDKTELSVNRPDIPSEKADPWERELEELASWASRRMTAYESERAKVHWRNDDAYRHIERAFGELSLVYSMTRNDVPKEEILREAADAINHIIMAIDIGSTDYETLK